VHPTLAHSIVDQRRTEFMARAEAHRQALTVRNSPYTTASSAWAPNTAGARIGVIRSGASTLDVRPIDPSDRERLVGLVGRMSPNSRRMRFWGPVNRLSSGQLDYFVNVDHDSRDALVAMHHDDIVAVARYDGTVATREAEVALAVDDEWQRRGIGRQLMQRLAGLARVRDFDLLIANILPENRAALALVRDIAPSASVQFHDGTYHVTVPLLAAS
jgi:GNAT superfamily N-acetyltransferase